MEQGLYLCLCNAYRIHSFNVLVFYFSHYLKKLKTKCSGKFRSWKVFKKQKRKRSIIICGMLIQITSPQLLNHTQTYHWTCFLLLQVVVTHALTMRNTMLLSKAIGSSNLLDHQTIDQFTLIKEPPSRDVHLIANHPLVVQLISEG